MSTLFKYKVKINSTKFKSFILCSKQINTTEQRNALNWLRRSKTKVDSKSYPLIYNVPLVKYLKWALNTSTATAALIAGLGLYKYMCVKKLPSERVITYKKFMSPPDDDIWHNVKGFIILNLVLKVYALVILFLVSKYYFV